MSAPKLGILLVHNYKITDLQDVNLKVNSYFFIHFVHHLISFYCCCCWFRLVAVWFPSFPVFLLFWMVNMASSALRCLEPSIPGSISLASKLLRHLKTDNYYLFIDSVNVRTPSSSGTVSSIYSPSRYHFPRFRLLLRTFFVSASSLLSIISISS